MKTKDKDLLNELVEFQLQQESMNCITGGGFWDPSVGHAHIANTKSGELLVYQHSDGTYTCALNKRIVLPHELCSDDRTLI